MPLAACSPLNGYHSLELFLVPFGSQSINSSTLFAKINREQVPNSYLLPSIFFRSEFKMRIADWDFEMTLYGGMHHPIMKYNILRVPKIKKIMEFEWDIDKNQANQKKHQISFEEAAEIFRYPTYEIVDTRVGYGETRYIAIGSNSRMTIMTVVYTEREGRLRLISARRANKQEKRLYYDYCT
jgi:hypothetical protein